jgi:hypothetical protein
LSASLYFVIQASSPPCSSARSITTSPTLPCVSMPYTPLPALTASLEGTTPFDGANEVRRYGQVQGPPAGNLR